MQILASQSNLFVLATSLYLCSLAYELLGCSAPYTEVCIKVPEEEQIEMYFSIIYFLHIFLVHGFLMMEDGLLLSI